MVGEFKLQLSKCSYQEFGWVKYWQMMFVLPNLTKFSRTTVLRYTVY